MIALINRDKLRNSLKYVSNPALLKHVYWEKEFIWGVFEIRPSKNPEWRLYTIKYKLKKNPNITLQTVVRAKRNNSAIKIAEIIRKFYV